MVKQRIAVVEKYPSKYNYKGIFNFEFDLFNLVSSNKKVLKRDIDPDLFSIVDDYDYIITVGAEASKFIAKVTSVTSLSGYLVNEKFIPLTNPIMLNIKPEAFPAFEKSVERLHRFIDGFRVNREHYDVKGIDTREEAEEYLDFLLAREDIKIIAMDTETTGLYPRNGYVLGIAISHEEKQGYYINADVIDEELAVKLQEIALRKQIVFHNAKFDIKMLKYYFNMQFPCWHDTLLLHYLLNEQPGTHGLKTLALKYTDLGDYDEDLEEFKRNYCKANRIKVKDFSYDLIPWETISLYAGYDTACTLTLFNKFFPIVSRSGLNAPYERLLQRGTAFLIDMEEAGIPFNRKALEALREELKQKLESLEAELYTFEEIHEFEKIQEKKFNPNSPVQLRQLLFNHLGLEPTGKKTETGADSTDAESLLKIAEQHKIPSIILAIRKTKKIKSTYVDKILLGLDKDDRLRTGFGLTTTTSGRLSSSGKLNAQQMPRDDKRVKASISARKGYKIVSQDLITGEMWVAAVLSGDKNLQQVFKLGVDFHSGVAHMIFKLPCKPEEVKGLYPHLRQAAKAISFGINSVPLYSDI